jgi:hypothetical protein
MVIYKDTLTYLLTVSTFMLVLQLPVFNISIVTNISSFSKNFQHYASGASNAAHVHNFDTFLTFTSRRWEVYKEGVPC